MGNPIESITSAALGIALDAASLRQQAIASNIANAGTEGYVPVAVNFESQLEDARRSLESRGSLDPAALAGVSARIEPASTALSPGDRVHLDAEMGKLAQNALHYQALVKGLSKHYAILSSAVADGKK